MSYLEASELNAAVVLDNGSGVMKIGFSGEESPRALVPTVAGLMKHRKVMLQAPQIGRAFGKEVMKNRGLYKVSYPIENGVVKDWDQMTELWRDVYKTALDTTIDKHPALLTDSPLNPYKNRNKTAETFFESFDVPALYFAPQPVLALYASGRLTGSVLDSGHGVTMCVPICEGFALPHAIVRMDVAGDAVTRYFRYELRKYGVTFHTTAELETVRTIKEKFGELKDKAPEMGGAEFGGNQGRGQGRNFGYGKKKDEEEDVERYQLPDGKVLQIGSARFKAPEVLFNPSLIGKEYRGIHYCVLDSIAKADLDLRKDLYQHILLSGGSTQFKNFGRRLLKEIQGQVPDTKIKIWAPQQRNLTTWIGGSLLSGLGSFHNLWISKKEYQEQGARVLYSKALL